MKRLIIIISVFILVATVFVGCGRTTEGKKGIIPSGNIQKISVELFDKSKKTFEGGAVSQVTEMINKATPTREKSVQDTPNSLPLGKITINDGEEVIYYYQKNDKYYIEKPYSGIYETSIDINNFLSELTGSTLNEHSLSDGLYALNTTKNGQVETPYLLINANEFNIVIHDAVSYQPSGIIERDENKVIMKSEYLNDEYVWAFQLTADNTLMFLPNKSNVPASAANWENSMTFTLSNSDIENSEKLLPSSLGITIPNINMAAVKDNRIIEGDEIDEAIKLGKTKEEAQKMTRYELTELINLQKLDEASKQSIAQSNSEISREELDGWTYSQYNDYIAEKNRKQFMPDSATLKKLDERGITLDDFEYLHKLYGSDDEILAQDDETLKKALEEWYLSKIEYAKEASGDTFYMDLN